MGPLHLIMFALFAKDRKTKSQDKVVKPVPHGWWITTTLLENLEDGYAIVAIVL